MEVDPDVARPPESELTVVGIGTSAGGLAALRQFFDRIPADSGLSFVVVVHLAPEHKSHLADLLQPNVRVPVRQVTETTLLEPNQVYVIPPNANISAIDTHLRLTSLEEQRSERAPIDHFFRTLAATHDGHAIGVILTGTGSDGTLGIRDIKAKGGLIVVQDPNDAEYDGMPQSAVATGVADLVLPLPQIPEAILRFHRTEPRVPIPKEDEEVEQNERILLQKLFALLRARTDRDFSQYKRSTILRRIARRMQLNQVEDLHHYVGWLRDEPEEARALAEDFLVTVTSFFRDPEVYGQLEKEIVPRLFSNKGPADFVRVWSVGCATGEEAYSLSMLLVEQAGRLNGSPRIQVFASDLHKRSLERAREGYYPGDIETDVSRERLARFFVKDGSGSGYRVLKELRDLVVFAPHNLLADPPFSRLDLLSCRNVLIYLERDVQRDVIELFHYALNPEGVLVLGPAETIEASDLFRAVDKKLSIYRKRNVPAPEPRLPVFPLTRTRRHYDAARGPEHPAEMVPFGALHQRMVELYAPPSMLISSDNKLVHLSENAGRYLVHPGGELTSNVFRLVREELRAELRELVQASRERRQPADSQPIPVSFNGDPHPVLLHVRPSLEPEHDGFALVIFEERAPVKPGATPGEPDGVLSAAQEHEHASDLESELALSRQRLQAVIDKFETGQEEMKASNEELQSTNEELRSTMEELETSKEELQSINEELQTVNQENRHKVEELSQLSTDLHNLLAATEIATLFLDRHLRILRFTPKLGELFNVRPTDRGRPISDLTNRLGYINLVVDARAVLDHLSPVEREVQDEAGRWYLTRLLAYRAEDRIEGVVITFVDITRSKQAEQALLANQARLRKMMTVDAVGVMIFDQASGTLLDCNDAFLAMFGYTRQDVASGSLSWRTLTAPEYIEASERELLELAHGGRLGPYEKEYFRKDGSRVWMVFAGTALGDGTLVEYCMDVMDRKRVEQELREAKTYAESIIEALPEPLLVLTPGLRVRSANPAFYSHFKMERQETLDREIYSLGGGQWNIPALRKLLEGVQASNRLVQDWEIDHQFESIGRRVMLLNARKLEQLQLILLGIRDITEKKRIEEQMRQSEERYRLLVENAREYAIFMLDPSGRVATWTTGAERIFGYAAQEIFGQPASVLYTEEDRNGGVVEAELQAVAGSGYVSNDLWQVRKDGSRFWASGLTQALPSGNGSPPGYVRVVRDNSERRQSEESLSMQQRILREANESLTRANADLKHFAFAAGHDLREPLRILATFSQRLLKAHREGRQEDLETAVHFIAEGTARMDSLLRDLLAYSQVTLSEGELETVDSRVVVAAALHNLKRMLEESRAVVTVDSLPLVRGGESHYVRLFQNLIENSIKYRSQREPEIHVSAARDGAFWRFSVRDNGLGIDPEHHERIFGVFKRLHGSEIPGTGVGLAICRRIVERSGGRVWVESAVGHGSTFHFTLPSAE